MNSSYKRYLSYLAIITGAILIFYINNDDTEHPYYLIGGIVLLMFGLYSVGSSLTSRPEEQSFIVSEDDEKEET